MYLSGTLIKRTIDFHKEKMTNFDKEGFETDLFYFTYMGEIIALPFSNEAKEIERKMITRQEKLIIDGVKNTYSIVRQRNFNRDLVMRIINRLRRNNSFYTYALLECLYKIILNAKNYFELEKKIEELTNLIDFLEINYNTFNTNDLNIIIELFLEGKSYQKSDIETRRNSKFRLGDTTNLSNEMINLIRLGEFIAPTRLTKISKTLQTDEETSRLIAPIYFAIKDDNKSELFLKWCHTTLDIDFKFIENKVELCNVPDNLLNLVRRKN